MPSNRQRKKEVILAQINIPFNDVSVPLAAGYLKAAAYGDGLLKHSNIEILDKDKSNKYSDANLISYLVSRKPHIIGFSCYVWNIERTLHIIKSVKKEMPSVKIVCGGSHVSAEYKKYTSCQGVDIIVRNEGEPVFVDLLKNFIYGNPKLKEIKGISFKEEGRIKETPAREPIKDLNFYPSPYLKGFIDPRQYGRLFIETYRGCPEKCTYCNWRRGISGIRFFSTERVKKEMEIGAKLGIKESVIIDPIFNLPANLKRHHSYLKGLNKDKAINISVDGRAEYITEETIKLLKECNVTFMTIGLQSANPESLRAVKRSFNRKMFIEGMKRLKKSGIKCRLDLIIGLPMDTKNSISESANLAVSLNDDIHFEILRVHPDACLKEESEKYGLKHMDCSPYFISSTDTLSNSELRAIWKRHYKNQWRHPPFIADKITGSSYLETETVGKKITTLYVPVDNGMVKDDKEAMLEFVNIHTNFLFHVKDKDRSVSNICEWVAFVSSRNPCSSFRFIIDDRMDILGPGEIERIVKSLSHESNYIERRLTYYDKLAGINRLLPGQGVIITKPFDSAFDYSGPSSTYEVIWVIPASILREVGKKGLMGKTGILLDMEGIETGSQEGKSFLKDVISASRKKMKERPVYFSNYAMQLFYDNVITGEKDPYYCVKNINRLIVPGVYRVLCFDSGKKPVPKQLNVSNLLSDFLNLAESYDIKP